ncbi:MAG: hypothetical protein KF847_10100 [Pirellulales bacterium]|nr:hypothetical protein [Pirellulales bacterium]
MGVDPDPPERRGTQTANDQLVEEIGDRGVDERDGGPRAPLTGEPEVGDERRIGGGGDPQGADLGRAESATAESLAFQRERPEAIGQTRKLPRVRLGAKPITKCGLLMHASLAVTTQWDSVVCCHRIKDDS